MFNAFYYLQYKNLPKSKWDSLLRQQYCLLKRQKLNLRQPQTFDEKIQWLKLYDHCNDMKTQLTDKYAVRQWIADQIGEEYLVPLLGKWDRPEDIDYDSLPEQFVLKGSHGCGCNVVVKDKNSINKDQVTKAFKRWLKINYAYLCGETQYENIKPCIIAEEYIADLDGEIPDYKVWCFNGKAHYIMYLAERAKGLKMAFFDRDWSKQDFVYSYPRYEKDVDRPACLEKLLEMAELLSKDFYHVRVDFYILKNGQIKFGEMTFSSAGGKSKWNPPEADLMLGKLLQLPTDSEEKDANS